MLVEPIANNPREFLLLYKEAHKLKFIPPPTIKHKVLNSVFNEINGRELTKKRITEAMQTEKTTEFTIRPADLLANAETPSTINTTDESLDISTPTTHCLGPPLYPLPSFNTPCPQRPDLANPYIVTKNTHAHPLPSAP